MRYLSWTATGIVLIVVALFLHYTLPQTDIVRVVGTDVRRIDFGENSIFWAAPDVGTATASNRDVRFIATIDADGDPSVYRNEDTGWGWPPYFKLDSSNLQAEASDLVSTADAPRWAAVTHYGWRSELLTIFPNAVGIRPVAGPDVRVIPWVSLAVLTVLGLLAWFVVARLRRFRARRIDPLLGAADARLDAAGAGLARRRRGFRAWLDTWKGKPRI